MKTIVYRQSYYNQRVKIGEFNDIYHPLIFLKGLLDRDNFEKSGNEYFIEYIHDDEEEAE